MIRYTLGFLFNRDLSRVLLIHKLSPAWQKGKINGLGGKFEKAETYQECIVREVKEETGLVTQNKTWTKVGELRSSKFYVDVLSGVYSGQEADAKTLEKEKIEWFAVDQLPDNIMGNLSWLVPLCLDTIKNPELDQFVASYDF